MEIEELVQTMRAQGVGDSTGLQFTLDLAVQAQKMSQYQVQEPALWLLKGVQAAVASGAPEVSIQLTRQSYVLRFVPPPEAGQPGLDDETSNWISHLRLALQAALSLKPSGLSLSRDGSQLYELGSPPSQRSRGIHLQVRRSTRPWWKVSDPELLAVHKALAWRAALCPIRVVLDGRELNLPFPERLAPLRSQPAKTSWGDCAIPYHWLAERQWPAQTGSYFCLGSCIARSGLELTLGKAVVWNLSRNLNSTIDPEPVTALQHLETEAPVREQQLSKAPWSSVSASILPGILDQVDGSKVLPLALELSTTRHTLYYSKILYLEEPFIPLAPITTVYKAGKKPLATLACQRWLGLSATATESSALYYVKDGILLNPLSGCAKYPGTIAFIADSQVATDLSQLNLVLDPQVAADQDWLQREEARLQEDARAAINSVPEGERLRIPLSTRTRWRELFKGQASQDQRA